MWHLWRLRPPILLEATRRARGWSSPRLASPPPPLPPCSPNLAPTPPLARLPPAPTSPHPQPRPPHHPSAPLPRRRAQPPLRPLPPRLLLFLHPPCRSCPCPCPFRLRRLRLGTRVARLPARRPVSPMPHRSRQALHPAAPEPLLPLRQHHSCPRLLPPASLRLGPQPA